MTTYAVTSAWAAAHAELIQQHNSKSFQSSLNGSVQTGSLPGARWGWNITFPEQNIAVRSRIEALLTKLSGREHRLQLHDLSKPTPRGTINLSGVTAGAAAQFVSTMVLAGCGNTKTLLEGDWISVVTTGGVQIVMVTDDSTSDAGGNMSVNFRHPLRAAVSGGATVVTNAPVGLFVLSSPELSFPREAGFKCPQFSISFGEVFS